MNQRIVTAVLFLMTLCLVGCALQSRQRQVPPDYYTVTAEAKYRPVDVPGTQRRQAQMEAEEEARKKILNHVVTMRVAGKRTVNDFIMKDSALRAKVLEIVRKSEVVDWQVFQQECRVRVCMRLDRNKIRNLFCGSN